MQGQDEVPVAAPADPEVAVSGSGPGLSARLAACRREVTAGSVQAPERIREILAARARQLRCETRISEEGESVAVLEFKLGEECFAFPLACIGEVCPLLPMTEIPNTPAWVLGVVNLRSRIYSVVDLRRLLELPAVGKPAESGRLLILSARKMEFAVPIDRLIQVGRVFVEDLQSEFSALSGRGGRYFKGVTAERLVLLDAEALLADEELLVK